MPEGPSLFIVKESLLPFAGKKIISASGNAKIDMSLLTGKKVREFRLWGKQLFIFTSGATIRIHFLMFGSYSIGEQIKPEERIRLCLQFKSGIIYFYSCSVKTVGDLQAVTTGKPTIWANSGIRKKQV